MGLKPIAAILMAVMPFSALAYEKLGLIIGNNTGLPTETPLKYAGKDAREVASAFTDLGSFYDDRMYVLEEGAVDDVKRSLTELKGRIKELKRQGKKIMFLLYFSGHGSKDALHIKGKALPREYFMSEFESVPADLKLLIVDACESGALIRDKGGRVQVNHEIEKKNELQNKGAIVISSASKAELAHESEAYQGAVFTHHLVNGLRGVADYNSDREVSLWEVFQYASISTRGESIHGQASPQNPSFDMDVVGEEDVTLTTLHSKGSRLLFDKVPAGVIDVYDATKMELYARLFLPAKDSSYFDLPAKKYILTYEKDGGFFARKVDLTWKNTVPVSGGQFVSLSKAEMLSKGGRALRFDPHAVILGGHYMVTEPFTGPLFNVIYNYRTYGLHHELSAGFGSDRETGSYVSNDKILALAGYKIKKPVLNRNLFQILAGAGLFYGAVFQEVTYLHGGVRPADAEQTAETSRVDMLGAGIPLELCVYLPFRLLAAVGVEPAAYVYKDRLAGMRIGYAIQPLLSVGVRF